MKKRLLQLRRPKAGAGEPASISPGLLRFFDYNSSRALKEQAWAARTAAIISKVSALLSEIESNREMRTGLMMQQLGYLEQQRTFAPYILTKMERKSLLQDATGWKRAAYLKDSPTMKAIRALHAERHTLDADMKFWLKEERLLVSHLQKIIRTWAVA